jgi:uncharacterized protein (TIGR03437 family)
MCHFDTKRRLLAWILLIAGAVVAQTPAASRWDWRPIGSPVLDLALAGPAGGGVERVWFSTESARLFIRTRSGKVYSTSDGDRWVLERVIEPPPASSEIRLLDALGPLRVWQHPADPGRLYALGASLFRSDDGGRTWVNLTNHRGQSIIGDGFRDLALSPRDPDLIVVANAFGVWRSVDGGLSWSGLNENLPNLPVRRILALPEGSQGLRIELEGMGPFEWAPGARHAWQAARDPAWENENRLRALLSGVLEAQITAVAVAGEFLYAGSSDGRLWASPDQGRTWRLPFQSDPAGPVARIWVDNQRPQVALAALSNSAANRVLRTTNGGLFWDDLSADLPAEARAYSITADPSSSAAYVATDRGVFYARVELDVPGPPPSWSPVPSGLPEAPARDVRLDPRGNRLFVALEGYGVYSGTAPHRTWSPRPANGADFSARPAAPGSLLSIFGARVEQARVGLLPAPVLSASDAESQIQIPFEARGETLVLDIRAAARALSIPWPLESVSPAIVVDRDGSPLLLDADTGILLDATNPARSGSRLQVLATGLGEVKPPWPAGLPAPLENPPAVVARLRAYLDRVEVPVVRAVLAPGYAGLYLVEIQLPEILNRGPAEFFLEAEGRQSNRVRVYVEP